MINRFIFWLTLLGMILTLHLWIQKSRGFDQGCLGLETHVAAADDGCHEVSKLPGSHLLGVSNAAWGYAFYFGLALLSFAKMITPPGPARQLHRLGEIGVALACLYSGYLVYQMGFVAHQWCVLCLGSASLVALLLGLHIYLRLRGGFQPLAPSERSHELAISVAGLFAMSGVLVGVLLFVNRLGTRPLNQGSTRAELQQVVGQSLPLYIDSTKLGEMRACRIDRRAPRLDLAKFVTPETPFLGSPDGVPIVAFYDPNCGFCRHHYPEYIQLAERFKTRAKFYVVPRRLWSHSELQIAALYLAAREGHYFDLWAKFYGPAFAGKKGMTLPTLETLFHEVGLNTDNLAHRLAAMRPEVKAKLAAAQSAGIRSTPTVYINGERVASYNHTPTCIGKLIDAK